MREYIIIAPRRHVSYTVLDPAKALQLLYRHDTSKKDGKLLFPGVGSALYATMLSSEESL